MMLLKLMLDTQNYYLLNMLLEFEIFLIYLNVKFFLDIILKIKMKLAEKNITFKIKVIIIKIINLYEKFY